MLVSPLHLKKQNECESLYWYAAYNKFIDKSKIIKIFSKKFPDFEENLSFKSLILNDFQIYFNITNEGSCFNTPLIMPKEVKLLFK